MSVEFEEEKYNLYQRFDKNPRESGLSKWLINHSSGLIKDDKQANYVLIIFSLVLISITAIILMNHYKEESYPVDSYSEEVMPKEEYFDETII